MLFSGDAGFVGGQGSQAWEETKAKGISKIQANLGSRRGPGLADASERLGSHPPSNMAITRNSCSHNLGAAWRRFFKIAARVQARGPGFEGCLVNAKPISNHGHGHSCHL
jgi:hypothetical protein